MAETGSSSTNATVTVAVTQPEQATVNVVAAAAAAAPAAAPVAAAKTPPEPTPTQPKAPAAPTASEAAKPVAAPTPASNPEPAKTSNPATGGAFQSKGDDFYNTIFYFSGMGSVIGNALAQGVYVSEQNRRNAIDPDDVGRNAAAGRQTEQMVVTARGQAQHLSTDFHKLQGLLESLPIFTGTGGSSTAAAGGRIDQPIHGELYFRCKERFPVQPSPTPTSQIGREAVYERPRSRLSDREDRGRRRHDDSVLDEVARAAVEAFPLLPPARGVGSSPTSSGRASRDRDWGGAVSPAAPRRRPAPAQSEWTTSETTTVDVRPWQLSHLRQYDVADGLPAHRP